MAHWPRRCTRPVHDANDTDQEEFMGKRYYSEDHLWIDKTGDKATVGLTDFAQEELGDILHVDLPERGKEVVQGMSFGTIESVKTASDLIGPASGEVAKVNAALAESPELINESPEDKGWLIKLTGVVVDQDDPLMDADAYRKWMGG